MVMWVEGYLTDKTLGEELDFANPPASEFERYRNNRAGGGKANKRFGFTLDIKKATQPYKKVFKMEKGDYIFYIAKLNVVPYRTSWIFLVMDKDVKRQWITPFRGKGKMKQLRDVWVETFIKNKEFIESIEENKPVNVRVLNYLRKRGQVRPLKISLIPLVHHKYVIVEGQEFVKPVIWRLNHNDYKGELKSPSLAIYYDWINNFRKSPYYLTPEELMDSNWLENTGFKDKLLARQGKRNTYEGLEVVISLNRFEDTPTSIYMAIGNTTIFSVRFDWSGRKVINGKKRLRGVRFDNQITTTEYQDKIDVALEYARGQFEPFTAKENYDGKISNPNRPMLSFSLVEKVFDDMRKIILK